MMMRYGDESRIMVVIEKKHAYLIVAHKDPWLLDTLIRAVDDERNDIFLHVDIKADFTHQSVFAPRHAGMIVMPRMNVTWGGDTQIECTLRMLEEVSRHNEYSYVHLISGADLPIKSQDYIHAQLNADGQMNYIKLDHDYRYPEDYRYRIGEYHFLQNRVGRRNDTAGRILRGVEKLSLKAQRSIGIDRIKKFPYRLYKSSNWFSITGELVKYLVHNAYYIRKNYYKSFLSDEVFLPSVIMNSPYASTVVDDDLRMVDWTRGNPYIWRSGDFAALAASQELFARKFDTAVDSAIVARVGKELALATE